jgi:hypothetical protein
MRNKKLITALTVVVLVGVASVATYFLIRRSETPATMGHGELFVSNPPALNQTATLTYVLEGGLSGVSPGERFAVLIGLDEGFIWVDSVIPENRYIVENRYLWQIVTCPENIRVEVSGTIKAVKIGRWNIKAYAAIGSPWGGLENIPYEENMNIPASPGAAGVNINITVTENSAQVENGWYVHRAENENIHIGTPLAPHNPVQTTLSFSNSPCLDRIVDLTCKISSSVNVPSASVEIKLPDGFVFVDGNTSWDGDLYLDSPAEFNVNVKAIELGDGVIRAFVWSDVSGVRQLASVDQLYVSITKDNVLVSHTLPLPKSFGTGVKVNLGRSRQIQTLDEIPPGQIKIVGSVEYVETDGSWHPLRLATVEIYDEELLGDELLGTVQTIDSGMFEFGPISNDDGPLQGTRDIYIVVVATNIATDVLNGSLNTYKYRSTTEYDVPDGLHDVGDWGPPQDQEGAWRVFKYVTDAWDYVVNGPANRPMRSINVVWPNPTQTAFFYDSNGNCSIRIAQDYDFFSYVAQHEYGHFVMYEVYNWWMPPDSGGEHQVWGRYTPGLAWSEGWADFFPLLIQDDPWSNYVGVNFEIYPSYYYILENKGDDVEGRVAGALWDIYDSHDDTYGFMYGKPDYDKISLGFGPIWDVFTSQVAYRKNNFAEFWGAWKQYYSGNAYNVHFSKMALFQNTIDYNAWDSTCSIGDLTGTWQISPVTLTATAFPPDPDPEDKPYLSARFEYSTDGENWWPAGVDDTPTYVWTPYPPHRYAAYSIDWDAGNLYDNTVYAMAIASDGMKSSFPSITGPFGVGAQMDKILSSKNKNNTRQDQK